MKLCSGAAMAIVVFCCAQPGQAEDIDPSERTADMPDSWLVLYNASDVTSTLWKDWYISRWGIPPENTLGLDVSTEERVQRDHFHNEIFYPVRDHLNNNPDLKAKIMGILVGFRVPGNYYLDGTHPPSQGGGGWSAASNLQDLKYTTWYGRPNPHHFAAYWQTDAQPLTKADLATDFYITARLDAPTVTDVGNLTTRARTITTSPDPLPGSDLLYYDQEDIGGPAGDDWTPLVYTLECEELTEPGWRFPWLEFDSDNDATPDCAMRFSYYRLIGWNTVPWGGDPLGTRILAFGMNSFGATTVRSTTDHNGRFVPNAIVNGGFAAALGATGEPYAGNEPQPSTVVWCLSQGWTLGEAVFRASPVCNHMWGLVGDPLLRVPQWFVNPPPETPSDLGPPELAEGGEATDGNPSLTFTQADTIVDDLLAYQIQIDNDEDFASPVVDYSSVPLPQGLAAFTVGQPAAGGAYAAGGEGQALTPGAYRWRVRSQDDTSPGGWGTANDGEVAFVVAQPLTLVSAASRKPHGYYMILGLDVPLGALEDATVECRWGGPTLLALRFSRPVTAADGVPDGTEVQLSLGVLDEVTIQGSQMIIGLSGVPNCSCLTVTVGGIVDQVGRTLSGQNSVYIKALRGDTNKDGRVNMTDASQTRSFNGHRLGPGTGCFDLNLDGRINLTDMSLVASQNGNSVPCQ